MANTDSLDNIFQALADPTRRAVINRLGSGPASTKELAEPFDMALPSFMQHLAMLEDYGLVASQKVGRVRTYEIQKQKLLDIEAWIAEQRAIWELRTDRFADFVEDLERQRKNNE